MTEPIKFLFKKYGFDVTSINEIVSGTKYTAVILENGHIGVCANLMNNTKINITDLKTPDISSISHRIILNAYYNALLNYSNTYDKNEDIYESVDFNKYHNTIMIGFFKPLLKRFEENHIELSIFDILKKDEKINQKEANAQDIKKADAIILSSTTIFNNTFLKIVNSSSDNCDIYMLGPSSILHKEIFLYKNIKGIFGSTFKKNDEKILELIKNGFGTRDFLKLGFKVSLHA